MEEIQLDQAWFHRLKAASSILVRGLAAASAIMLLAPHVATAAGGGLYVPNLANVAEFQGRIKNGKKPHRVNRSGDIESGNAVAFDPNGNIWVTNFDGDSIIAFTRAQFRAAKGKRSAPTAIVKISQDGGANLAGPEGIAFDSAGTMWVGSEHGQEVLAYSPGQYAASGSPTPNVILNANSFNFSSPSTSRISRTSRDSLSITAAMHGSPTSQLTRCIVFPGANLVGVAFQTICRRR